MTIRPTIRDGILNIQISHGSAKTRQRSLGVPIRPKGITKKGKISVEIPNGRPLKDLYQKHEKQLEEIFINLRLKLGRKPVLEEILTAYDNWRDETTVEYVSPYLLDHWDPYFEERKLQLKNHEGSMKKVTSTENDLVTMEKNRKRRIQLKEVGSKLVVDFIEMLEEGRGFSKKVNGNNRIAKKLSELRGFLEYLERKGLHKDTSYDKVKVSQYKAEEPTYTLDELEAIYNCDVKGIPGFRQVHENVRDLYCFCGETAVSHRDLIFVKQRNIHEVKLEVGTVKVLRLRRSKTHNESVIPLTKSAIAILEKHNYNLPRTSNQECNTYIKQIARACGIEGEHTFVKWVGEDLIETTVPRWKAMKFHSSRRSFITNHLMEGQNMALVGKMAGQKNLSTTMGYLQPGADRQTLALISENLDRFI